MSKKTTDQKTQDKNQAPAFVERLRFLMDNHGLPFACLDSYVPQASRELRGGRKFGARSAGKLAKAIWGLHVGPMTCSMPKEAVEEFWGQLGRELNRGQPLPAETDFAKFNQMFSARLVLPPRPLDLADDELAQRFSAFFRAVAKDCSELVTRGINLGGEPRPLRLAHVYVSLDTKSPRPAKGKEGRPSAAGEGNLSALEVLFDAKSQRIVLVGEPGSGKSTFLQYVTLCLADRLAGAEGERSHLAGLEAPELLRGQKALPLRILLRDFASSLGANAAGTSEDIIKFLDGQLRERSHTGAAEALPEVLRRGLAFVLFDGLDEAPRSQVAAVRQAITAFAGGEYQNCRVAVTCRTESYKKAEFRLPDFPEPHEIAPLSAELRTRFVHAWYEELEQAQPQFRGEGGACAASLAGALASERLKEMAANPFFLTAMAALHRPDKPLPDTGAELMDELVTGVLEESRKRRAEADPRAALPELVSLLRPIPNGLGLLRLRLETIAYLAREKRQDHGSRFVDEDLLRSRLVLARDLPASWVDDLLEALRHRAGLLQSQDGQRFEFAYRFEEFLAGCHLTNEDAWQKVQPSFTRRVRDLLARQGDYARLAVIWAAGFNVHVRRRKGPVRELVSALAPGQAATDDRSLTDLELAADVAHDAGMENWLDDDVPDTSDTARRLRARLEEVRDGAGSFDGRTRSRAASALGRLGDRRPGVGLRAGLPDIHWIPIPAGVFKMSGKEGRQGGREFTCRMLEQRPYKISRYPITVAQYRAFVDDKGYEREFFGEASDEKNRIWTKAGWAWRQRNHILGPVDYDAIYQTPNHPRVGVSWYEAAAFCRWLTKRLQSSPGDGSQVGKPRTAGVEGASSPRPSAGEQIALPSEAEWERAARGTRGRLYPWGAETDLAQRCNMGETGINHTSAVGLFPSGDTPPEAGNPRGVADLAGNVWEWCRTPWLDGYKDYEKKVADDLEGGCARVLRGGSWSRSDPDYLLSSSRFIGHPVVRVNLIGFRCVVVGVSAR